MVESKRTFELLYDEPFNVKLLEDSLNEIKENSFDVLYRAQYKMNDMQRFDLKMGEFTLDFDANGGTCDVENKIVRYGKGVGNLPIATREGYVFVGWYTQPEGGYLFANGGDPLLKYMTCLIQETRKNPMIEVGSSPRGTIALMKCSKALALLSGRDYVLPEDIKKIFIFN